MIVCSSEMDRYRKQLEVVIKPEPEPKLRGDLPSDVHKVIVGEEHLQEWGSSLDQENPEPPHIKEEQEELWISQEGEQLKGLEEADIKFSFTSVPVKSEDDEEKPQSSQLHQRKTEQIKTEAEEEDCGVPEPARNSDPDIHLLQSTDKKTGDSSEPETDDSDDWKGTRKPQSGLNSLNKDKVSHSRCSAHEKPFICSVCGKRFGQKGHLRRHVMIHSGEKPFSCSVCGKSFIEKGDLKKHLIIHTGEKPFSCRECGKEFVHKVSLQRHLMIHSGEKPFSCSVCGKSFIGKGESKKHLRTHSGEKQFICSECGKRFAHKVSLKRHVMIHTGEKPLCCTECGKRFCWMGPLKKHLRTHTGEKNI